jgi:capsular exopolysaccharide synthesis family protein
MAPDGGQRPAPADHDLRAYLKAIRRRMPLILLLTGIVTAAAVLLSLSQTKQYEATARIVLSQADPINQFIESSQPINYDPESDRNTRVQLIKLDAVADAVRNRLNLDTDSDALVKKVETEVENNSDIVTITATDPDPRRAAAIATAFAEEYQRYRRESARRGLNDAAEVARQRLSELGPDEAASDQGRELRARLREIEISAAAQNGGVEVAERADVPADPARPRPLITGLLALFLGFAVAVALAAVLEFVDRRLRDDEDVENAFGLPILATIPKPARRSQRLILPGEDRGQFEGYSALATNLRFFELGPELESIMITSPGPGEGKTSVTLGTARALAALDLRVIAIEADLRRPTFANYGVGRGAGLSTVLAGVTDIDSALIEVDAATMAAVDSSSSGRSRSFHVLPAGPPPPNPQALLARPMMTHVIDDARAMADVVLVDVPPLGTVNDPVTLANLVDGVVLVARLGHTTRDASRRTLRVLENVDARILGVVVTGAPAADGYYGAYGASGAEPPRERPTADAT